MLVIVAVGNNGHLGVYSAIVRQCPLCLRERPNSRYRGRSALGPTSGLMPGSRHATKRQLRCSGSSITFPPARRPSGALTRGLAAIKSRLCLGQSGATAGPRCTRISTPNHGVGNRRGEVKEEAALRRQGVPQHRGGGRSRIEAIGRIRRSSPRETRGMPYFTSRRARSRSASSQSRGRRRSSRSTGMGTSSARVA